MKLFRQEKTFIDEIESNNAIATVGLGEHFKSFCLSVAFSLSTVFIDVTKLKCDRDKERVTHIAPVKIVLIKGYFESLELIYQIMAVNPIFS